MGIIRTSDWISRRRIANLTLCNAANHAEPRGSDGLSALRTAVLPREVRVNLEKAMLDYSQMELIIRKANQDRSVALGEFLEQVTAGACRGVRAVASAVSGRVFDVARGRAKQPTWPTIAPHH
jgi:hypothetical protein